MSTTAEFLRFGIKEPKPGYHHVKHNRHSRNDISDATNYEDTISYKQVARIIHHLCRDLKFSQPQLKMPSAWMLRCLTFNAYAELAEDVQEHIADGLPDISWQRLIADVLRKIHSRTDVGLEGNCCFTQLDRNTALFPNSEQFDEWDAYRLSQALLHHLDKELN